MYVNLELVHSFIISSNFGCELVSKFVLDVFELTLTLNKCAYIEIYTVTEWLILNPLFKLKKKTQRR